MGGGVYYISVGPCGVKRTNVVHALADIVATKLGIILLLVRAECVRTNVVRVLAEIVATKLGIILLFFLLFFPSTYFFPRRGLPTIFACLSK